MLAARDWDEQYLLNFPPGEFDWVEAKGRRLLDLTAPGVDLARGIADLSKAVSAFANSGGGVLVLGAVDPKREWRIDDGGIDLMVKPSGTRAWLEDIIPAIVDPTLTAFNVYELQAAPENSQIAAGRGVFIVDIRDSLQAPHQAKDNIYYGRVAGKSKPLSHRFVMDIVGRRRDPDITLEFRIETTHRVKKQPRKPAPALGMLDPSIGGYMETIMNSMPPPTLYPARPAPPEYSATLVIKARNVGRVFANYVNCSVYIPGTLMDPDDLKRHPDNVITRDGVEYYVCQFINTRRDITKYDLNGAHEYGPSLFTAILPECTHEWGRGLLRVLTPELIKAEDQIVWELYADNAGKKTRMVKVRDIEFVPTVLEPREPK